MDASIVAVPSSTKNRDGKRDQEMRHTQKGRQWHFGMGADGETGIAHSLAATAANESDLANAHRLPRGGEARVWSDSGCREGGEARREPRPRRGVARGDGSGGAGSWTRPVPRRGGRGRKRRSGRRWSTRRDPLREMLADLRMPGALEAVDEVLADVDGGAATAGEATERLLAAQIALRNDRRLETAMRASRLPAVKTLAEFDFAFQPSIKREQIESLHELGLLGRGENVILLGPPGVGKTHLAVSPAMAAAQSGHRVYHGTLAGLIESLEHAKARCCSSSSSTPATSKPPPCSPRTRASRSRAPCSATKS